MGGQLLVFVLKPVSGRPESLSSPSVSLRVRDLHANGRLLSTGEPEEEQRLLVEPHTAFASSSVLHLRSASCPDTSRVAGAAWRRLFVVEALMRVQHKPQKHILLHLPVCVCVCVDSSPQHPRHRDGTVM